MTNQEDLDFFDLHASFCRIFADPKRSRIMWYLGQGERSVGEIAEYLGVSLQNVSQHLRIMREKGALSTRKEGQVVYYSISNTKFLEGARLIREGLQEEYEKRLNISLG